MSSTHYTLVVYVHPSELRIEKSNFSLFKFLGQPLKNTWSILKYVVLPYAFLGVTGQLSRPSNNDNKFNLLSKYFRVISW